MRQPYIRVVSRKALKKPLFLSETLLKEIITENHLPVLAERLRDGF